MQFKDACQIFSLSGYIQFNFHNFQTSDLVPMNLNGIFTAVFLPDNLVPTVPKQKGIGINERGPGPHLNFYLVPIAERHNLGKLIMHM